MGSEQSTLVDESTPPATLSQRSLKAVADLIQTGEVKRIVVMTGAGISTSSGIPDFRSPGTGLYDNLALYNLPYPEAVFDIAFFRDNPDPFYDLARELYPGKYQPTVSHTFIALLARKGLLWKLFTQNIDCLERAAGVPADKIVEAHGSFAAHHCIDCKTEFPDAEMQGHVREGTVPRCATGSCDGLVKPDIVFFGEALPEAFHTNRSVPAQADLVIIMGTSLSVQPFAGLPEMAMRWVPRVLFNLERVGSLGSRADDVLVLGDCDTGVRALARELGWADELEAEWRRIVGAQEADRQTEASQKRELAKLPEQEREKEAQDSELEKVAGVDDDELSGLAAEMKETLKLDDGADDEGHSGEGGKERHHDESESSPAEGADANKQDPQNTSRSNSSSGEIVGI